MLALGASCPWFESKYPYLNGLCSVIRLAQDICNVLEEFKSHKVHTMFSCFHNVELLLNPLLGSQRLKKLPYQCSLVQWFRTVPLQGKGHQFDSNRSNIMGMELIWYKLLTVNQKRVGLSPIFPAKTFARSLVKQLAILDAIISESSLSAIRRSNQ